MFARVLKLIMNNRGISILLVTLIIGIFTTLALFTFRNKTDKPFEDNKYNNLEILTDNKKTKFETFPIKKADLNLPAQMYGLWPYGVKGSDGASHNEGHPGWDFELKKGSKVYAIADLEISQIHEGDHQAEGQTVQVIEASAKLNNQRYHIVYHSVINLEPNVKERALIKAGQPLAEVGFPLSENSAMIHFGIFPPNDSVGACPSLYFSEELQSTIEQITQLSFNMETGKPYESACVGKINRKLYEENFPDRIQYYGGAEQWE